MKETGTFIYDGITWRTVNQGDMIHVRADIDRTEMWIKDDEEMPLVLEIRNNPLGIDWRIE